MGDWSSGGKLSRYITSHPRQLSLAIPLWVGAISTNLGLEGNRRSGVALAMRHSGVSTYGLNGLWKGDEHPTYAPSEYGPPLPLPFTIIIIIIAQDREKLQMRTIFFACVIDSRWFSAVQTLHHSQKQRHLQTAKILSTNYDSFDFMFIFFHPTFTVGL